MLKKRYRLPADVRIRGGVVGDQTATLFFAQNGMTVSRFRFLIPKRIDKRAVTRNTIRRKASACIEEMFEEIVQGEDILISFKKSPVWKDKKDCYSQLRGLLVKGKLLQ